MLKKFLETYFRQYRPFFIFLLKFFVAYIVLTVIYQFYLDGFNSAAFEVDGITQSVALQTEWLLEFFGYDAELKQHISQPSVMLLLNGNYLARIVEGCNVISVLILFIAFVFAFKGNWKKTLLFIILGSLFIHILNIVRIALLSMALLRYPEYGHVLHAVIFPLFIYGVVFILWIIWVNKFSIYAKKPS